MKKLATFLLIIGCLLNITYASAQDVTSKPSPSTTFILVRHAEKADDSRNTDLSQAGFERAQALDRLLSQVKVDAILTTPLNRTQQTAQVVAQRHQLRIQSYDIDASFSFMTDRLAKEFAGKTVMIVGHSNTLPINIARLTNKEVFIPESEFDNVFIINVQADGTATMLQLKYGNS